KLMPSSRESMPHHRRASRRRSRARSGLLQQHERAGAERPHGRVSQAPDPTPLVVPAYHSAIVAVGTGPIRRSVRCVAEETLSDGKSPPRVTLAFGGIVRKLMIAITLLLALPSTSGATEDVVVARKLFTSGSKHFD